MRHFDHLRSCHFSELIAHGFGYGLHQMDTDTRSILISIEDTVAYALGISYITTRIDFCTDGQS